MALDAPTLYKVIMMFGQLLLAAALVATGLLSSPPEASRTGVSQDPEVESQEDEEEGQSGRTGPARPRLEQLPPRLEAERRGPLLAVDGAPVEPGRIPAEVSEEARELWRAIHQATVVGDDAPARVSSFSLTFDVVSRHDNGKNDLTIDVLFQDRPRMDWMRTLLHRSGRVQLRGPGGDFLLENEQISSLAGRENEQSRRDMDRWIAVANHFLTLVNAGKVRLVDLELVDSPVDRLPASVGSQIEGLRWLEVTSPDFHLYPVPAESGEPVMRATLGVREDGRVMMTLIEDTDDRNAGWSRLVTHERWAEVSGRRMPKTMYVYRIDPLRGAFYERPVMELTLYRDGSLNPPLGEDSFRP